MLSCFLGGFLAYPHTPKEIVFEVLSKSSGVKSCLSLLSTWRPCSLLSAQLLRLLQVLLLMSAPDLVAKMGSDSCHLSLVILMLVWMHQLRPALGHMDPFLPLQSLRYHTSSSPRQVGLGWCSLHGFPMVKFVLLGPLLRCS
jgi:hypothetical protein